MDEVELELWRPIAKYEGYYEVSSLGRVRSLKGCTVPIILKAGTSKPGYKEVTLIRPGVKRLTHKVHRLVLRAFVGEPLVGQVCRHLNGIPADNRLENLAWGTYSENMADSKLHGTLSYKARGLSIEQVKEARRLVASGVPQNVVAERLGTNCSTISEIIRGDSYRDVV